jgi:hypothetical protein
MVDVSKVLSFDQRLHKKSKDTLFTYINYFFLGTLFFRLVFARNGTAEEAMKKGKIVKVKNYSVMRLSWLIVEGRKTWACHLPK